MRKRRIPQAVREIRKIRDEIHREAMALGFDSYYEELNSRTGWLLGEGKKARRVTAVHERPSSEYKAGGA